MCFFHPSKTKKNHKQSNVISKQFDIIHETKRLIQYLVLYTTLVQATAETRHMNFDRNELY